ncbi:hypothetical protein TRIATDRAFT_322762 [Trichoderma atroviride IMI 206040]|uniref:Uncharacterized protein n=1 Tax=Hypocrea atroviridis (strain ATCC 20476 / IMI 206040) TaxID=452589 RepID=G9P9I7_HYPAI|nr:uncharacterized protein TRIATDRAFT_322762 [Trichoderma atroviride IMI 206040]EHK40310.1 hypothetical protein TRIATDRAFT_322762 [Trichoderma atroviride IMI 206040]
MNRKPTPPPVKMVLKPVPDHGTRIQSPQTGSEVQFVLPGTLPEPEVIRINTATVSQPFLEPDKLEQWK